MKNDNALFNVDSAKKYYSHELLERLCQIFGPSGCEEKVAEFICAQLTGECDCVYTDRLGNVIAEIRSNVHAKGIKENTYKKLLIATHMDETGMMIDEISKDGYLYFTPLGKIDPRVLCGKNVIVGKRDDENGKGRIHGIISSKAIHHQSPEERKKVTPIDKMYIDIGESDHDGVCKFVSVGDFAVFDNSYVSYGSEAARLVNSSALDARMPCAALIDAARRLNNSRNDLKCDIYFVFGTRGALGYSGISAAANRIAPDLSLVVDMIEAGDVGAGASCRARYVGKGAVLNFSDRNAVYDKDFSELIIKAAQRENLPLQINGNTAELSGDAARVQLSACGSKCAYLSMPGRYLRTASVTASLADLENTTALIEKIVADI